MKDIKKQIEKIQTNSIGYDLNLQIETNKYGYDTLALYLNQSRLCALDSLTNFEKNYIINRINNVYITKETRCYKGEYYDVIVVRENDGFDNESIVLKFSYDTKTTLLAILSANKVL